MANFVAGSVSVLVKPVMKGFHDDLKKQLSGTGLESVGRDIADDVTKPLKDEAKKAGDPLKKELPKDAKKAGKEASEQIRKQMKNPLKRAKIGIGNTFKKLGKKAGTHFKQNFGRMIKGGLLFAGTALAGGTLWFGKEAIQEASNLEQSVGAIDSVFGDLSSTMHQFSEEAAQTLGLSKNEYNELATLMGTQLKVGGLDGTELTSGVQDLMGLSADLSSMFGGTTAEANTAISALLRGETEPIRRYGVSIDQAAVKNKALEMGLISQGEEMDAAARQQATLALLYEQTGDAQGNFARESDTLANKQQRASAAFDNLKASVGEMLLPAMTALFEYVIETVLPAIEDLVGWVKNDLIPAFQDLGTWFSDNMVWIKPLALIIGGIAVALGLVSGALSLVTLATTAWGIALSVTPLGWIVIAIGAVVGALVWFFTQTELGAELWDKIWGGIKTAAGAVWNWIKDTLWPGIVAAWDAIAAGAIWLYENAILPAWNAIKTAIAVVVDWIVGTVWPALQTAWQAISDAALWLWNSVFKPVWDGIRIAVAIAVGLIMTYIDLLKWYFTNVIAPVAMWLWNNVMKPVWNGIKAAIGAVVTWFKDVAWPLLSSVIDWIKTKFEQFKIGLGIIWNFIKNRVINPVITWFQTVVWPIISKVIDWIKNKFEMFKLGLQIIWNFIKNKIINPVIAWFQNTAWPLISSVIDSIKRGFNVMKDGIKAAWDFVKNRAINPIVSWFEDKVLGRINTFVDKVKSAFQGMKDGIGEAFNQVKGKVRGPIEWLIDTVVNDSIIDNINSVLSTFGMEDKHIGAVSLPAGFATGGYTGPGSKYQPAGIVHADEYVIRKESQRSLRRAAPGFLDSLNKYGAGALGYATGGLVSLGPAFTGSGRRGDGYGARGGKHKGIDWALPHGTALIATADGTAIRSYNSAAGNKLTLSHGNGIATTYHHLSGYAVPTGARVNKGQVIGYVGSTGRSSGPHLHLGVQKNGTYVNPDPYLTGGGEAGSGGMWNPFAGLWDSLKKKVSDKVGDSVFGQMLGGMPKYLIDQGKNWFTDQVAAIGDFVSDVGGATRWSAVASEALLRENQFGPKRLASLLRRMGQESGYNPNAINNWDVNAKNGTPSKGLMQVIQPTFDAYRDKSLGNDIWDPLQNIVASIRYTLARYGNLETGWDRPGGYAEGGLVKPYLHDNGGYLQPGLSVISNQTRKPEHILTDRQWDALYTDRTKSREGITQNLYIRDTSATVGQIASELDWGMRSAQIRGRV